MVEFFVTDTLDCSAVFERIRAARGDKRQILLVPDRFMLYYEKAVMEHLGEQACFDIEVVSFARLATKTLGLTGENFLSPQGAVMLLRKVIEDNKDELVCFRSSYGNVNFASEIYAVISQIRNSGISTEMIAEAAKTLPAKVANKTADILRLYRGYVDALRDGLVDGTSKLALLIEAIERDGLEDADVYITDYLYLTGTERSVCEAIFKRAHSTCVFFVGADDGAENGRIFPKSCLSSLIDRARQAGCAVKIHRVKSELRGDKAAIASQLFSYNGFVAPSDGTVRLWSSSGVEQEVMRVAREIRAKVNDGARYRDFAVVCCDAERYLPVISRAFARCGIPCFADRKKQLSVQAVPRLVLSAMRAVAKGFRRREVCEFCRNGVLGIDRNDADIFDNYCLKYGIDGFSPSSEFSAGKGVDPDREIAEKVRAKLVGYLRPFSDKTGDVASFAAMTEEFLRGCDIDAKLNTYAQKIAELDDPSELSSLKQSVHKFKDLIDQSVRLMGSCRMSLSEYCNILAGAAAGETISMVPLSADCVFVGESRESRYDNISHMYVVGAVAGKLPPEHGEGGIFATKESREWSKAGLEVEPDTQSQNNAERLNTLMFLLKPSESLTISYPCFGDDGKASAPSAVIGQLSEMLAIKVDREKDAPETIDDFAYKFADVSNAMRELLLYKAEAERGGAADKTGAYSALRLIAEEHEGADRVQALLSAGEVAARLDTRADGVEVWRGGNTSVSQFEKYFKCPFMHYMDHILRVRARDEAKIQVAESGSIIHDVLQRYFSLPDYAQGDRETVRRRASRCVDMALAAEEYARICSIPELRGALAELRGRCEFLICTLVERMAHSSFKPYQTEQSFGFGEKYGPIVLKFDGKQVNIRGRMDRIDRCKDYAIILDYKSAGSVKFALPDVYFGSRIQLLIYMKALAEAEHFTPAGVFYLPMNNSYVRPDSDGNRFRYIGFANTDGEIPELLDSGLREPDHKGELFPIESAYAKEADEDGEYPTVFKGIKDQGTAVDTLRFRKLCDYAFDLVTKAAKEMDGGFIAPVAQSPAVCEYCAYGHICGKEHMTAARTASDRKDFEKYSYFATKEANDGDQVE